ncbi:MULTISPECIES: alpha/beta fold hydrolase [Hyphomicrobiales]|jgi:pimeloyl-ACP methyl ester carboxylesterase|uniref:Alpha/beta hydrolase n=2 Tax=Pleomorphomonas TaxID=261933 RepID=A0A2G9X2G9_9HYPH|nr:MULTISPECIES: alpha/beta fold hydrolase [Hyphomicrobiales]AWC24842.1 Putative non-heme bromoperoxidase BpoC [Aminobacter sp. MSH1]MDG9791619.1 alpha/beta fold hydrolase [Brucella anthropi]MDH0581637.1 alpha/beta fold hydrolase [Brucella anthropi]MDH0818547.1 alpha/beta fold hydrolase [Brucella anthropi]MDH2084901.1 alpha/beta fold hydrolase [Brucella anthropi]
MLNEQIAKAVGPAHIDIAYEQRGNAGDPAVLLIMGLAGQLVHWPTRFLDELVSRGFHVIRFDNRDSGHSTHLHDAPKPDLAAAFAGDLSSVSYTLSDMAADAVGLLDFLGIEAAHVVGASMGAAIAQTMAIEHPARVRTLTSMMFSTGGKGVGLMHPEAQALFTDSPPTTREEAIEQAIRRAPKVRSPAYPTPPQEIANITGQAWDRDHDILATARQSVATVASGDRTEMLRGVAVPTLVIHGTKDTICDVSGGQATAAAIPGAELVLFEGMAHDFPAALAGRIADCIAATVQRGKKR